MKKLLTRALDTEDVDITGSKSSEYISKSKHLAPSVTQCLRAQILTKLFVKFPGEQQLYAVLA